jgi:hypothetical protein
MPEPFCFGYEAESATWRWAGEGGRLAGSGSSLLAREFAEAAAVLAWTLAQRTGCLGGWWAYRQPA